MAARIVVLGAGFGGLELSTVLSEALGDGAGVTLIDKSDHFVFGFSKLDVMFGRETPEGVRLPYSRIARPGVQFRQETITAIDPVAKRVTTDGGAYDADVIVVALGADYEPSATPGLLDGGNEFYSVAGATKLRDVLPSFTSGRAIVGVTSTPFKCPPAPSECALMLHDFLVARGHRDACEISLVMPFGVPVPPAPDASRALMAAFEERGIAFVKDHLVRALDPARKVAVLDDGSEMPYDLFLGIPKHRVPAVVQASGLCADDGWIAVDRNLRTRFPGVYAVGDVNSVGTPKAGVFAEGAATVAAESILAELRGQEAPPEYGGTGACYFEFGGGRVGRVDVTFAAGSPPTGSYVAASIEQMKDKQEFGATRRARWFSMD